MKKYERLFRKFGRRYQKDSYIFTEGDSGREMYYIISGRVRVEKETGQIKKVLAELESGDYFGEMAPIIDTPRTASAIAIEDSSIAVIDSDTFRNLLAESRGVSLLLLREFSFRLKRSNESIERLARSRLKLIAILYLINKWPPGADQNLVLELSKYTGKELIEIREILEELENEGLLVLKDGKIFQFNREKIFNILHREAAS